jgi:hypothetical protein
MAATVIPIVLGFLLTGLVANRLLQSWQLRRWLQEQRYLGQEKEYQALRELAEELSALISVRIFHMRLLNRAAARGLKDLLDKRLVEYDSSLRKWNERLSTFYIRLPLLGTETLSYRLERSLQKRLVATGAIVEDMARTCAMGNQVAKGLAIKVENDLNDIHGRAIIFNQELLQLVKSRRTDVYFGTRIKFKRSNLARFSTWYLIKAIFVRDIDSLSVTRASLNA